MEWRFDTENAPRDGTPFLAEMRFKDDNSFGGLHVVRWDDGWRNWVLAAVMIRFDETGDESDDQVMSAWMPLPAPPKAAEKP